MIQVSRTFMQSLKFQKSFSWLGKTLTNSILRSLGMTPSAESPFYQQLSGANGPVVSSNAALREGLPAGGLGGFGAATYHVELRPSDSQAGFSFANVQ